MTATKEDAEKFTEEVFQKLLKVNPLNSKGIALLVCDFILESYEFVNNDDKSLRRYEYCLELKKQIEKL